MNDLWKSWSFILYEGINYFYYCDWINNGFVNYNIKLIIINEKTEEKLSLDDYRLDCLFCSAIFEDIKNRINNNKRNKDE